MPSVQSYDFEESTNQELITEVESILNSYHFTKEYTHGEFDCSDMAKQVMNILEQHNISSFLVCQLPANELAGL